MEANKDLEKQILDIWDKLGTVTGWTEKEDGLKWPICIEKEDCAKEIAALFENMYPVEFIEWFTGKDSPVSVLNGDQVERFASTEKDYTIKELYEFWKTEILKKGE